MAVFSLPPVWDSLKFAARYKLDPFKDYYVDGNGELVVAVDLPDNPPIFDLPDPPGKSFAERIDEATTLEELKTVLKGEFSNAIARRDSAGHKS